LSPIVADKWLTHADKWLTHIDHHHFLPIEDKQIALVDCRIVLIFDGLPCPCLQVTLHLVKNRFESIKVLARSALGDFFGGFDFPPFT
jgi:hypothetical protein